jgi:hypothetical protein
MPIGQFLGSKFPGLRLGSIITGPFEQIANFFPETAAADFGALMKYGSTKKNYVKMVGDETDMSVFAGIVHSEVAASSYTYPGVKTRFEIAEPGNILIQGAIAVKFTDNDEADVTDATEGKPVYLDSSNGMVTCNVEADAVGENDPVAFVKIPNLIFTGDTETIDEVVLVGVRKLY